MDQSRVEAFLGQFVTDAGATGSAGLVVIGHRLGLYRSLAEGPATAEQFADRTGCAPRYLTEWLRNQAAGGYVTYDPATGEFSLTEEQAFCLADPDGPNLPAAFLTVLGYLRAEPQITEAFRTGEGFGWHRHDEDVFVGVDAFFRPGYIAALVPEWIPALEGVEEKLREGALVADVGCGHGASTIIMAQAYPKSQFVGYDYHEPSIERAQWAARQAGIDGRVIFQAAASKSYPGQGYDLVAFFDCLHDMGDPAGAAAHVRQSLAPDGTWMIVEPFANDRTEDNLNPVGRVYYSASSLICTLASQAQEVGTALGAQAGEARLRYIAMAGGFTQFRRAAETPFNLVFEARP
jgi:SAM-dependent methyltransferase